jgi:exonuclease SbcC
MIPVKLRLHNFMSYRDIPPLSFESIHTACISGNNGNGKSALIDALTWALWGQTRALSDDELIYTGQSEVEVEFEFAVNRQNYRILRKHSKPKSNKGSGQTILEFHSVTSEGLRTLTAETINQTQQRITQTLHMDYDTFINSAFIRQGHADEFTKKRPSERKQVLGNILQLTVYDALEVEAREMGKEQDLAIIQLESSIEGIKQELLKKSRYQNDFENAQILLTQCESACKMQNNKLSGLRKDLEILKFKKSRLDEITSTIANNQRNLKSWTDQSQQSQTQIETYQQLISRRESILGNYSLLLNTRKQIQELDQKLKLVNGLTQTKHKLDMAISKAGKELTGAHAVSINRISDWDRIVANLPNLQSQMAQLAIQLNDLERKEVLLVEQQIFFKQLQAKITALTARQNQLAQLMADIDEKLRLLIHSEGAICPLCEGELSPEGHQKIQRKYSDEKSLYSLEYSNNSQELFKLASQEKQLEKLCLDNETNIKNLRKTLQTRHGTLAQAISDVHQTQTKIDQEQTNRDQIESRLAQNDYALDEQSALMRILREIEIVQYDAELHDLLRNQLSALEKVESPWHQLVEAEKQIVFEQARQKQATNAIADIRKNLEIDNQRMLALSQETEQYSSLVETFTISEMEYERLMTNQRQIQEQLGGAKTMLERLVAIEQQLKQNTEELNQLNRQSKIFKDLAQAFGKKGVQAMLIEMALPEIEAEANQLLARMTDNRMFIKMEPQRSTKKGDVIETLDINISDELGTRNYEMFSGGEAFRIDFAIRIALSKLLARRAGAPLPTLIIDEGFGTQDGTGIEKIKEAITSIQDDFEKILVITHISDFKDAFPVRIEVVKTADGSTVYLN